MPTRSSGSEAQHVWPLPLRLAHWTLATLVIINLFNDHGGEIHRWIGYAAAVVVGFRLIYGMFTGHRPARLHWPGASSLWTHARAMMRGSVSRVAGHNPLGAAMTLWLWCLVLLLGLSGWVGRWDRFWGEDWPQDLHAAFALMLEVSVIVHLAGVVISSLLERQNLVAAMISGNKRVDPPTPGEDASGA